MTDEDGPVAARQQHMQIATDQAYRWAPKATQNEQKWGVQHPEELLSAIVEEVGELEQAYLEATHEGGEKDRLQEELDDLGALLIQFVVSYHEHPMAFEPLPTAEEAGGDGS